MKWIKFEWKPTSTWYPCRNKRSNRLATIVSMLFRNIERGAPLLPRRGIVFKTNYLGVPLIMGTLVDLRIYETEDKDFHLPPASLATGVKAPLSRVLTHVRGHMWNPTSRNLFILFKFGDSRSAGLHPLIPYIPPPDIRTDALGGDPTAFRKLSGIHSEDGQMEGLRGTLPLKGEGPLTMNQIN